MAFSFPISLDQARAAHKLIKEDIVRTPLLRLKGDYGPRKIYLKPENLQPINSFKIRGAATAIMNINKNDLKNGIWTVSAGNMAQAVAWYAKKMKIPCSIVVPDTAPEVKLDAIKKLGAKFVKVPFKEWFDIMESRETDKVEGYLIHPFNDQNVITGNGTIGIEIFEDLPEVDTVIVPYGGGGLITGIASVLKQLNPNIGVYACEPETAAALSVSLKAGEPTEFPYEPSFVDGMGSPRVFPKMWEIVKDLVSGSLVISIKEIAEAVNKLAKENKIIAEGAGAASVAAAMKNKDIGKKIVCIVSGGSLDSTKLIDILQGFIP